MIRMLRVTTVCVAMLAMAGCASMVRIHKEATHAYKQDHGSVSSKLDQLRYHPEPTPLTSVSALPYVNTTEVAHQTQYPAAFSRAASMNSAPQDVWQLMQQLSGITGYAVTAADGLLNDAASSKGSANPRTDATLAATNGSASTSRRHVGAIAYNGTLLGLLNFVGGQLDATWTYDAEAHAIHFFRYETKVFHVATVPGATSHAVGMGSGGGSGQSVSGSRGQSIHVSAATAKAAFVAKDSVWQTLKNNIAPMLSPQGTLAISEPTASITVRDRWDHVAQVGAYIHTLNRMLTTQVKVSVAIYRVTSKDSDSRGLNWNVLYDAVGQMAKQYGVSIATPRPSTTGMSSLILTAPTERKSGNPTPYSGSQAFLEALSTIGRATVVTRSTVITVNNVAAPFRIFTSQGYLAQTTSLLSSGVSNGNTSSVGAGATLMPGNVETGYSLSVLPSVQPDGHRLLLQVMISLSSLDSLKPVTSGGQMIQVPTVSGRQLMPRVWMRSGQSLILAGFQSSSTNSDIATPFDEHTWMFAGNRQTGVNKQALVIVITPVVTSHQASL